MERDSPIMVNGPLPQPRRRRLLGGKISVPAPPRRQGKHPRHSARNAGAAFAQILGKLNYFNLRENLQLILFDYEEKRSCTTNGAFNSTC
jgi:hypothetical protein